MQVETSEVRALAELLADVGAASDKYTKARKETRNAACRLYIGASGHNPDPTPLQTAEVAESDARLSLIAALNAVHAESGLRITREWAETAAREAKDDTLRSVAGWHGPRIADLLAASTLGPDPDARSLGAKFLKLLKLQNPSK